MSQQHARDHSPARQRIRYLRTSDGFRVAWAEAGSGRPLVKAANWLTHLEYEWQNPVWRHWNEFFSRHFRFVRYDERGCGMSDRQVGEMTLERWVDDLAAVVEAADISEPFALLGISQGGAACIAYAARYPERVSHLVLYGSYARGWAHRNLPEGFRQYQAIAEIVRVGWGSDNPAFRQVFTSRFMPGGGDEQIKCFNELCQRSISPDVAADLMLQRAHVDVTDLLPQVRARTLVLHARKDGIVPLSEGMLLAAGIAGAEMVELDSSNHILLEHEPAWARFQDAILAFSGVQLAGGGEAPAFQSLSRRERDVLSLVTEGYGNQRIADDLGISEKTVRNHISNLFDKLGVWTRAQAIVYARDRGFVSALQKERIASKPSRPRL
jgi:pimeloyl-ACP methyl ester carboxylesterase/DNA-binding CsgD family transcriptional regulator